MSVDLLGLVTVIALLTAHASNASACLASRDSICANCGTLGVAFRCTVAVIVENLSDIVYLRDLLRLPSLLFNGGDELTRDTRE